MKKIFIFSIMLAVSAVVDAQGTNPYIAKAQDFLAKLQAGKFEEASAFFDESVKDKINESVLKKAWGQLSKQLGTLNKTGIPRTEEKKGFTIVFIPCYFDNATLDMKLPFKESMKAYGFMMVPHIDNQAYTLPEYADPSKLEEQTITIQTGTYKLPGIYVHPKNPGKKIPVLILVHGSGPNDMDESIFGNKPFKDLAYGLAAKNIGVIRYDKRTKTYGAQMAERTNITLENETIEDAISAIKLAKQMPDADTSKIFVIGHSLGAMAAPQIAKYEGGQIAGIILMAGPARHLEELLLEQSKYLESKNPSAKKKKEIKELEKQVDLVHSGGISPKTPSEQLPMGQAAGYWIYLNNYNQTDVAAKLVIPMLVLQGERDCQVTMTDYELWKKALAKKANAAFKSYPKLNHLFEEGEGPGLSAPSDYETSSHIPGYVIDDVSDWIVKQ